VRSDRVGRELGLRLEGGEFVRSYRSFVGDSDNSNNSHDDGHGHSHGHGHGMEIDDDDNNYDNNYDYNYNYNYESVPLPIMSGACPAFVCFNEKESPPPKPNSLIKRKANTRTTQLVDHISRVRSPLMLTNSQDDQDVNNTRVFNVGIMPCHDKKIEAVRGEFEGLVDLVVTMTEVVTVLENQFAQNNDNVGAQQRQRQRQSVSEWFWSKVVHVPLPHPPPPPPPQTATAITSTLNNGSHASSTFAAACKSLFGFDVGPLVDLPWRDTPLASAGGSSSSSSSSTRIVKKGAANVTNTPLKTIELHRTLDGKYFLNSDINNGNSILLLRFGILTGFRGIQTLVGRTIKRAVESKNKRSSKIPPSGFHYLEVMACPSGGCLNGTGALPSSSSWGGGEETPTERKKRVEGREMVLLDNFRDSSSKNSNSNVAKLNHFTTYKGVVPLVFAENRGSVAGTEVQALGW